MDKLFISSERPFSAIESIDIYSPKEGATPLERACSVPISPSARLNPPTLKMTSTATLVQSLTLERAATVLRSPVVKPTKLENISIRVEAKVINSRNQILDLYINKLERVSASCTKITVSQYFEPPKMVSQYSISRADEGAKIKFYIKGNPIPIAESIVERTSGAMGYRLEIKSNNTLIRLVTQKLASQWTELS